MDKILEIGDSHNSKYPQHFQQFLDNCIKIYEDTFKANDYLFAAVYFIVLETGFTPVELSGKPYDSVTFDIRKLSSIKSYTEGQIKISNESKKQSKCFIYQIPLKLGRHESSLCELQGVSSAEVSTHLIINFFYKEPHIVKSLCLNTETYIEKDENNSKHKYKLKNLKTLSSLIKNKIAVHIKDMILINEEEGCSANLLCLPEEIQKKIIYNLKNDPVSIQYLASTCSYFYSFISKDPKLWEEICFQHFSGWSLNNALQEISIVGDSNIFRTTFFNLKRKGPSSRHFPHHFKNIGFF